MFTALWLVQTARPQLWLAIAAGSFLALAALALWMAVTAKRELRRRIEVEQEARNSEFQTRLLLDCSEDGIYALDPRGHCLWANRAATRLFGFASAEPMVGQQMHTLIHHTRPHGTPYPLEECKGLEKLFAGERLAPGEELLWRADGTSFWADVRVNPMARDGTMVGAVVVLRDITERRQRDAQLRQAQKIEAVARLSAGVAHEFNNLLSVITGHAELLRQRRDLDGATLRQIGSIEHAGHRAAELTRRLLAFSGQQVLQPVELQLNDTVEACVTMLRHLVRENVVLSPVLASSLALVIADPHQIEQALFNLVLNAADAIATGGRIEIRTAEVHLAAGAAAELGVRAGHYVTITVADTGAGMDAELQRHIFEPFFTTKGQHSASGLGLSTVFGFLQQSGGAVSFHSTPGLGTTVSLYLPAAVGDRAPASSAPAASTQT